MKNQETNYVTNKYLQYTIEEMAPDIPATFNAKTMKLLASEDRLICRMVNDLMSKGLIEENALEIIFNSEVLCDSAMEDAYNNLK